jgi:DNA-binding NarL/FixJ family response regulator
MSIRVLLVEDHVILREGIRKLVEAQQDMQVVAEASDGHAAVALAAQHAPQVVVMDISMPDLNGVEATRQIVEQRPGVKVVALTMHSNHSFIAEMLKAGASAYLLKKSPGAELVTAIRTVLKGQIYLSPDITGSVVGDYVRHVPKSHTAQFATLSPREREVLQLVAEGKTTKEIATRLHVSVKTIEAYRSKIMEKLQIHTIAGLTKFAIAEGITAPEP